MAAVIIYIFRFKSKLLRFFQKTRKNLLYARSKRKNFSFFGCYRICDDAFYGNKVLQHFYLQVLVLFYILQVGH